MQFTDEQIIAAARVLDPRAFMTLRELCAESGMDVDNPPEGVIFGDKPDDMLKMDEGRRLAAIGLAKRVAEALTAS